MFRTARYNAKDTILILIQNGADVNVKDINFQTPLHFAAEWNAIDTIPILIQHGADVDAKNFKFESSLHIAA